MKENTEAMIFNEQNQEPLNFLNNENYDLFQEQFKCDL